MLDDSPFLSLASSPPRAEDVTSLDSKTDFAGKSLALEEPTSDRRKFGYAWYVVVLLAMSNGISFFDRGFVALVIDPIKHTLHITDTEIGVMIGPAFILFYSTVSLPLGRLADSYRRKNIIICGMLFWSICTGTFGVAKNFLVLAASRMGVGLGEASLVPAGVSMIADIFPRHRISRAVAAFTAGGMLGGSMASFIGGPMLGWLGKVGTVHVPILGALEPWQASFVIISTPGVIVGLIILATMREPARKHAPIAETAGATLSETAAFLWKNKFSSASLILGFACVSAQSGVSSWLPTYYMRTFHLTPAQIGPPMGIIGIIVGVPTAILGGYIADRLRQRGREDSNIMIGIYGLAAMIPLLLIQFNLNNPWIAIAVGAPSLFAVAMIYGVAHPNVSLCVPANMRSQAVAIYLLSANTLGIGIVPLLIPVITDYVFHDPQSLRYAMSIVTVIFLPLGLLLLALARKPFIAYAQAANSSTAGGSADAAAESLGVTGARAIIIPSE